MIIPLEKQFSDEQFREVEGILAEFNCTLSPIVGELRTIYAIRGDERHELMINRIEGLSYVERVDTIQSPFKLMNFQSDLAKHPIRIAGKTFTEDFVVIAGQCTIDPKNPQFFLETAHAVKEAGADVLRGGVWKPRTSPHTYQGDDKAIDILIRAKEETGLPVNTEVMDEHQLDIAVSAGADMVQVGARNGLNYTLLRRIGERTKDKGTLVLLKRGMHMGSVDEFISAAEYIAAAGNPNILLCPRGTVPPIDGYRNHPDESITPLLRHKSWAPVVVDPSHSTGKSMFVPHAALAAAAYGADGLCIECHIDPKNGIGDDPKQAITPDVLSDLIKDSLEVHNRVRKYTDHHMQFVSR